MTTRVMALKGFTFDISYFCVIIYEVVNLYER